jgi:hypothetical protein
MKKSLEKKCKRKKMNLLSNILKRNFQLQGPE